MTISSTRLQTVRDRLLVSPVVVIAWMLDPTSPKDVKVQFYNTVDGSTMKELKGTNCYCIDYVEKWEDGQDHYEQIEIVCQKLENGAVAYDNPWK